MFAEDFWTPAWTLCQTIWGCTTNTHPILNNWQISNIKLNKEHTSYIRLYNKHPSYFNYVVYGHTSYIRLYNKRNSYITLYNKHTSYFNGVVLRTHIPYPIYHIKRYIHFIYYYNYYYINFRNEKQSILGSTTDTYPILNTHPVFNRTNNEHTSWIPLYKEHTSCIPLSKEHTS